MKIIRFLIITVVITSQSALVSRATSNDRLIEALIKVESRGNDAAIGDRHMNDKAYGSLQIRKPCVDDVNRRFGTSIKPESLLGNRSLSVWVCKKYLELYATPKQIGREPTLEDMARIWNGGPTGWRKQSTLGYWTKVQKVLTKK